MLCLKVKPLSLISFPYFDFIFTFPTWSCALVCRLDYFVIRLVLLFKLDEYLVSVFSISI